MAKAKAKAESWTFTALVELAVEIADEAAQSSIESNCIQEVVFIKTAARGKTVLCETEPALEPWWNTANVDEVARDVRYLEMRSKLYRHPRHPDLVRVLA